jgi:hypothetical protein
MEDRRGKNTQLPLPDLLRQAIYSRGDKPMHAHMDLQRPK